jgi:hypothetical protein
MGRNSRVLNQADEFRALNDKLCDADVLCECEVIGRNDTGVIAVDPDATTYQSFDDKEILKMLVEALGCVRSPRPASRPWSTLTL